MGAMSRDRRNRLAVIDWSGKGAVVVIVAIVGLYGSSFGPFKSMLVGAIVTAVGLAFHDKTWAPVVLAVGVAVVIGACAFIILGIVMPHGTGSGSGSYCEPGLACQP